MTKLHEILAVENGKEMLFKQTLPEIQALFSKKVEHFWGAVRTLELFGEDTPEKVQLEKAEYASTNITTTVQSELAYLANVVGDYLDVMYQKDEANQRACAEIVVNGSVLAKDIPATTLLGLENKLKALRPILEAIPTLQPGCKWESALDLGQGVYRDANPEIRTKTAKDFDFRILAPATEHHPAQIERWSLDKPIGTYTKHRWCAMLSTMEKSELLARFDDLIEAVKQARCRANDIEIKQARISKMLFDWLLKMN